MKYTESEPKRRNIHDKTHPFSKIILKSNSNLSYGLLEAKSSAWGLFGWASNPWDVHGREECQQTQREKQTAGSSDNILEDHALENAADNNIRSAG